MNLILRPGRRPVVVEKAPRGRGAFGLDAPFPADIETIHAAVLGWLREVLPGALIVYPGAECSEPEPDAAFRKRGGVPGLPRLWAFMAGGAVFALEVKTQAGRLTARQQDAQARLRQLGFKVATVRGIAEARDALARWGIATREAAR